MVDAPLTAAAAEERPEIEGVEDSVVALSKLSDQTFDFTEPLAASRGLRRRQRVSRAAQVVQTGSAILALAVLGVVIYSVIEHAAGVLGIEFITHVPPKSSALGSASGGGGIAPEIVGTALIVGVATLIAVPISVLTALYVTEFASARPAYFVRLALDLLNGTPTIIIGLFIFGLLVAGGGGQSAIAASLALAIIMVPLIARAVEEVLLLVPKGMRDAADALGISRWRIVRGVVLPASLGGIVTATILSLARAAGETAPLLLVCSIFTANEVSTNLSTAIPNIPVYIFEASERTADPLGVERAWGAAFVLLAFILVTSLGGRALLGRSRAKLTQ
jgi:phosphate transport system permease protein